MTLLVSFLLLAAGTAAFLWLAAAVLQPYLYAEPASRLPVRSLVAGLIVAAYLIGWTAVNTRAGGQDRFGSLLEFNPTTGHPLDAFTAVRRDAAGEETKARFRRDGRRFVQVNEPDRGFVLNTGDYLTAAIEVADGPAAGRYEAELEDGRYRTSGTRTFREADGRRYVEFGLSGGPGAVQIPDRGAMFAALALNAGAFVVWMVAVWPVMRFTFWHAVGLSGLLGLATVIVVMPLLFDRNRVPPRPAALDAGRAAGNNGFIPSET